MTSKELFKLHDVLDIFYNEQPWGIEFKNSETPTQLTKYSNDKELIERYIRYLLFRDFIIYRSYSLINITDIGIKAIQSDTLKFEAEELKQKEDFNTVSIKNMEASISAAKASENLVSSQIDFNIEIKKSTNATKWLFAFQTLFFLLQLCIMYKTYDIESTRRQSEIENQTKPSNVMVTFPANYLQDLKYHSQGTDTVYISNYPKSLSGKNTKPKRDN